MLMKDKLVTLAIHTIDRALQLQEKLEKEGIPAFIKKIRSVSSGVRVRVREADLTTAMALVEKMKHSEVPLSTRKPFILVPMDFSEHAIHAGSLAFYLAKNLAADIVFLHIQSAVDTASFAVLLPVSEERGRTGQAQQQQVNNGINDTTARYNTLIHSGVLPDIAFSFQTKIGIPEDEIMSFSQFHQPLLLVMSTRSKSKKEEELIGSVAAEVIERSKIPVFVVPENTDLQAIKSIKHIAYTTNFEKKDLIAFERMMYFVQQLQFKVTFIHVSKDEIDNQEERLAEVETYFDTYYPHLKVDFAIINSEKSMLRDLDTYAKAHQIDVIAIRNYKRGMLLRLFAPSLARKLVYQAQHPLIVFY